MDKSIKNPEEETTLKSNTLILVCKHETHKRKTVKFCQYGSRGGSESGTILDHL